ncbi:MAG: hypothetical protein PVF54_02140 [Anaerolineae bacterium]|jgi:hypothetical protein
MRHRRLIVSTLALLGLFLVGLSARRTTRAAIPPPDPTLTPRAYLPYVARASTCPTTSTNQYQSGVAIQYDTDDPVRPAEEHADKNIELRGYTLNTDPSLGRELVDYGSDDEIQPPQFATLFDPPRVPAITTLYQVHHWNWASSPDPGSRGDPITTPPVTALALHTTPGETLRVPTSDYDIGGDPPMEVLVLFADEDTLALRYTREDSSGSPGYTVHLDDICTDPNLLALYRQLDDLNGPRYEYPNPSYDLPNLPAGQAIGLARGDEVVVAIVDTGTFQDPRSLREWWQIRPGHWAGRVVGRSHDYAKELGLDQTAAFCP